VVVGDVVEPESLEEPQAARVKARAPAARTPHDLEKYFMGSLSSIDGDVDCLKTSDSSLLVD